MRNHPRCIVTTTKHAPTPAVRAFDALPDWTLIVVGDRCTPADYRLEAGIYLSPDEQERHAQRLSDLIGWNCIQRRNLGFLYALGLGAEIIASVDDDNVPYADWGRKLMVGQPVELECYRARNGCFDPIGATEHAHLWHRGYPLQLLSSRDYSDRTRRRVSIDVQADFWDGDPDVDALCRLEHAPTATFDPTSFPFTSDALSPFNSQNTFFSRKALAQFCVLPGVGRMDDIWASYHLQSLGFRVAYGAPTVRQERNPHDLTTDLVAEFLGYERSCALIQAINAGTYDPRAFWPEQAWLAYEEYRKCTTE